MERSSRQSSDSLVFLHHSCGRLWLENKPWFHPSLDQALRGKPYVAQRHDITYGTDLTPDPGRPDSLGPTPGDLSDMHHWILWFNDYMGAITRHGCASGVNRIVLFKSCYPNSNVGEDAQEAGPGDPFDTAKSLANYRAVYEHPDGSGHTYSRDGYSYRALGDVFAENPDTLFVPITSPPRHYAPKDATTDAEAQQARRFNNWLKNEWVSAYKNRTGLDNVAIFDWFDLLAYPDDHGAHPNRLRAEFGGERGDSHPNGDATKHSTRIFAASKNSFLDEAWRAFEGESG